MNVVTGAVIFMADLVTTMRVMLGANHHKSLTKHTISDARGHRDFPPFVRLEIVRYPGHETCYLFHICEDGSIADTWHETTDDAIHQAEWEFGVPRDEWQLVETGGLDQTSGLNS